jgi:hypothetical protein
VSTSKLSWDEGILHGSGEISVPFPPAFVGFRHEKMLRFFLPLYTGQMGIPEFRNEKGDDS